MINSKYKSPLESYLEHVLTNDRIASPKLLEACRYSVLAGGKRVRGTIVLQMAEILGLAHDIMPMAAAVELIHTYSLIHDDLPCMDDDDFRRGKPTCHKVYGEDMALLAGDTLQTMANEIMSRDLQAQGFVAQDILKMLAYLNMKLGLEGMAGGQAVDIQSVGTRISLSELERMHELKTGAFLQAAFLCPVILSGRPNFNFNEFDLEAFCLKLGLLFQVIDDILDETQTTENLGKTAGSDKQRDKPTFTTILGVEKAQAYADNLKNELQQSLHRLSNIKLKSFLDEMIAYFYERSN